MTEFQQTLLPAYCFINIKKGADIAVREDVKNSRQSIQEELGFSRNDPKIGVKSIEHEVDKEWDDNGVNVELAPGITTIDCKWAQKNVYKEGYPLEAFDTEHKPYSSGGHRAILTTKLDEGAYIHFSTFGLVVAYDGNNKDFNKTFALLVEKRGKQQQQRGTVSIANQGIEVKWTKQGIPIEKVPLTTESFKEAIKYDCATTLKLDKTQLVGYHDIGLALMPGSIDAGGLVVANIDYKSLEKAYRENSEWKKPIIVPTNELSDFLKSGDVNVNSILKERSLGQVINHKGQFGLLYEQALKKGF